MHYIYFLPCAVVRCCNYILFTKVKKRLTMQFNSILYSILYLSSFATRGQHCRELCTFQLHI